MRITVQLINAADGYHIWSESYDRKLEDIFDVQDDISRTVANKLRTNLNASEHEQPLVKASTENLEAYKKYLQGLHYWNRQTLEDTNKALHCFREAVALEPGFADPYFNIVYITAFLPHAGILSIEEAMDICRKASTKAMEIDPLNARSQLAAGIHAFYFEWQMEKAESYLLRAIELNPNLSEAHLLLGWYRMIMQQRDKMDEPLRNAYLLDPMGGEAVAGAADVSFLAGKLDLADAYCSEALNTNPHNMYASYIKSMVTGFKGDWDKATLILEPLYQAVPDNLLLNCIVGYAYAKAGHPEKAKEFITWFLHIREQAGGPPVSFFIALLYLVLGDKENFYTYYEESLRAKSLSCLYYYNSPMLSDVNGEERIKKSRREFNLPE